MPLVYAETAPIAPAPNPAYNGLIGVPFRLAVVRDKPQSGKTDGRFGIINPPPPLPGTACFGLPDPRVAPPPVPAG